tara:strand:+ start:349 stop:918 length:570 start_codon:yes stop_codon:yes gene_type:complete
VLHNKTLFLKKLKPFFDHYAEIRGQLIFVLDRSKILECLSFLKNDKDLKFNMLHDLTCNQKSKGLEIVYQLHSVDNSYWITLKSLIPFESLVAPSATSVFVAADWHEREAFDMFGLKFTDHPDLRRILLPDDWEGHPLKKEYPLGGFKDIKPIWAYEEAEDLQNLPDRNLLNSSIIDPDSDDKLKVIES